MAKDVKGQGVNKTAAEAPAGGIGAKVTQAKEFYNESLAEMKKVVWPSRKETTATSIAVLVVVVVMTIYLGVVDMLFSRLVQAVLS